MFGAIRILAGKMLRIALLEISVPWFREFLRSL